MNYASRFYKEIEHNPEPEISSCKEQSGASIQRQKDADARKKGDLLLVILKALPNLTDLSIYENAVRFTWGLDGTTFEVTSSTGWVGEFKIECGSSMFRGSDKATLIAALLKEAR